MNRIARSFQNNWPICLVLVIAFILRVWRLSHQSFWLDELYTVNETDPKASWGDLFHSLKCCDSAPPLFFIFEKLALTIFGSTEFIARSVSVIAGSLSVWSMYLLGKEILNKNLGLIAAILTSVNYYSIYYSQEARVYAFAFLFTVLSFMYLIKLIKSPSKKTAILYAIFSLCLLYSHYYGLFVVCAQALLALLFILQEKGEDRKILFRSFFLSGIIIILGYLPMIPLLLSVMKISSSWIQLDHNFLETYFYDYFGNSDLLKPLLLLLLFTYFIKVATSAERPFTQKIKQDPLGLSFVVTVFWIFITLLIPYLKSIWDLPMLYGRYTIVVLPAIILMLAYAIELFGRSIFKYLLTGLFVLLSLIHLFYVRKYYDVPCKTQFREMTAYVVAENNYNYPLNNQISSWQQSYYLKRFHSKAEIFAMRPEDLVDSVLRKNTAMYDLPGFWLVGAHQAPMLDDNKRKELDTAYILVKEKKFLDAWAQLFISKERFQNVYTIIHYTDFTDGSQFKEKFLAIWNGSAHTKPVLLKKGGNKITISALGTPVSNIFSHVNLYCNGKKIGNYFLEAGLNEKSFVFELASDETVVFTIEMDNDLQLNNEDRNVLIDHIIVEKLPQ